MGLRMLTETVQKQNEEKFTNWSVRYFEDFI